MKEADEGDREMQPLTATQQVVMHVRACELLEPRGWKAVDWMRFTYEGRTYDLNAADLDQIDRIVAEGLFVVSADGELKDQAEMTAHTVRKLREVADQMESGAYRFEHYEEEGEAPPEPSDDGTHTIRRPNGHYRLTVDFVDVEREEQWKRGEMK
jgi:hypothetical protein